jgi:DNA-binding transcriptional LysR family regulator
MIEWAQGWGKAMSLNLQQLTTFCTVLNEGSMTAAAQKLYLTQPAISQQIRHLEENMGAVLLVRGVRQVRPTLQGQLLYDYAKRIIQLTQQAHVAIQTVSQDVRGDLRIGTLNSIGMAVMSPLVGLFLKNNAALRLQLNYGSAHEMVAAFARQELDVLILPEIDKEFEIEIPASDKRFLFRDEMKLVGAGRDPQLPRQIQVAGLALKPFVSSDEHLPRFEKTLQKALDRVQLKITPIFSTNNVGTLKRVVESGLGWGFLPSHSVEKQIRMGRLNTVDIESFEYNMNVFMYTAKRPDLQASVEVLYRAIQQKTGLL